MTQKQTKNDSNLRTTDTCKSSGQNPLAQIVDNRPEAVAQRELIDGIQNSTRMVAQRRQIEGYKQDNFSTQDASQPQQEPPHKPNKTGLPDNLKSGIEALSGFSMDNVKVHYNSSKPAQLNALAYAQGTDIHVAPGQEQHMPHEAWHVVQQAQGRVQPTINMKEGNSVNDNAGLEREADVMGGKAMLIGGNWGISDSMTQLSSSCTNLYQFKPDVYDRQAYANPEAYLAGQFPGKELKEDAGSGGVLDRPVQLLISNLANASQRKAHAAQLKKIAVDAEIAGNYTKRDRANSLAVSLLGPNVYDLDSVKDWVLQQTMLISGVAPSFLTIENALFDPAPVSPAHTFHRDHGKVVLTDSSLSNEGINSKTERIARLNVLNGPFGLGWVRGHYTVLNTCHRFIDHIHVDKEAPEADRFLIYDIENVEDINKALSFNINNLQNINQNNNRRVDDAAEKVEGGAKRLAWEQYAQTIPNRFVPSYPSDE
jgi:Domain of unknown function (DUF4157)